MKDYQNELSRCLSVVKWNPNEALSEMNLLRDEALSSPLKEKLWKRKAHEINNFLDSLENTRYYKESEFWKNSKPSRLII